MSFFSTIYQRCSNEDKAPLTSFPITPWGPGHSQDRYVSLLPFLNSSQLQHLMRQLLCNYEAEVAEHVICSQVGGPLLSEPASLQLWGAPPQFLKEWNKIASSPCMLLVAPHPDIVF